MIKQEYTKKEFYKNVHPYLFSIADILKENGFQAYLVGGAIRDMLVLRQPKDFDIATDASPEQITTLFSHSLQVGAKFGTIVVIPPDSEKDQRFINEFQVTTFRKDAKYINGRWPEKVIFSKTLAEDASRRDFTINALAIDLLKLNMVLDSDNILNSIIDFYSGIADANNKLIRAVGDPLERMQEDGLRAIRACRFGAQLHFVIEEKTFEAIRKTHAIFQLVSIERVREEFMKIVLSPSPRYGITLLYKTGLLNLIIPEIQEGVGIEQNKYHVDDIYNHLINTCEIAHSSVRLAALLHDIGKPRTKEGEHFFGHELVGSQMSEVIMQRMKFTKQEIIEVSQLISLHMFNYTPQWSDAAVRRFLNRVGDSALLEKLFLLRIADVSSNAKNTDGLELLAELKGRIQIIEEKEDALSIKDLALRGDDILKMGITTGPQIGEILQTLLNEVLEDPSLNNHLVLINLAKKIIDRDVLSK